MNYKAKQTCNAIITVISNLRHQRMTSDEIRAAHEMMKILLSDADNLGIPWSLQNAMLYIGEKYNIQEWYIDSLFTMAYNRAKIQEVII